MKGKPFWEAIKVLASISLHTFDEIKAELLKIAQDAPMQFLMGRVYKTDWAGSFTKTNPFIPALLPRKTT